MHVVLPDGKKLEFDHAANGLEVAAAIGPRLAQDAVAIKVQGELKDLLSPLEDGADVSIVTKKNIEEIPGFFRHTLAHVMAQAVREFYGARGHEANTIKMGVGPAIENGFYYDFDLPEPLRAEDLPEIEKIMNDIITRDLKLSRKEVTRAEALQEFGYDPYKVELINDLPEDEVLTFYVQEGFTDLCRGPHVPRTGVIPRHFKLMSTSGAYWRGSEKNPMMQRVYGVAFGTKQELDNYLHMLEEAKRRDHRKIGKDLELFFTSEVIGPGLPLWLPNGATIRRELERFIVDLELRQGYQHVYTPQMAKTELYKISGHWDHYQEDMFPVMKIDQEELVLRPMNCPHHIQIYKHTQRSYRDLPIKIAELGTMYRFEQSGELTGLSRVRSMTLNDAHIFVRPDQIQAEFKKVVELVRDVYEILGFKEYKWRLSLRDPEDTEKYFQDDEMWNSAEAQLRQALDDMGLEYYESPGDAAFYGPKLDVQVKSALGKDETISTVQLDFLLPQKFELEYVNEESGRSRPVMIHRGIISTMERMTAFLIENCAGDFPFWLAPEQVRVVPIADRHLEYAQQVEAELRKHDLRAKVDDGGERMNAKIRNAELRKVPFVLIVGDQEAEKQELSVRERHKGERKNVPLAELVQELAGRYRNRTL
ncbi:threonine--tRNA ligase [Deinococcus cellulosilyticus]|uniref:Threonine--tRNA ligase n=1 Tax=Deinococcus cellulosilyticus (strain DSM 18568 / NBRC 106333 / KACC 11606 / 5516J-15) TaxID=1223518 RepID=A0A511N3H0_DEIC1|nr:threonine--tRNA ligase [Deinococcus cellulosilyticus]GEM47415.1 threonine--tRNA ligase [Deinococcus cellulosilyticus NBRC 106333 = KACC 11606]